MRKLQVITWKSASGVKLNLTKEMEKAMELVGVWPRDWQGEPLAQATHGQHWDYPTSLSSWPEVLVALVRGAQELRANGAITSAMLIEREIDKQVDLLSQETDSCGDPREAEMALEALEAIEEAEGYLP